MKNFKTSLCLLLGLMIAPQALAHDMPVPHDHGPGISPAVWVAFAMLLTIGSIVVWRSLKQSDN